MTLDPARHLATIRREGARLAAIPADALDLPVPAAEGWTVETVLRHTGKVHRWATALLGSPLGVDLAEVSAAVASLPRGTACLAAYREALDGLVAALEDRDPTEAVPSFVGPADVAFWLRRQAHELGIHRDDAQVAVQASGGAAPDPVPSDVAADGVDEWLRLFVATRWPQRCGTYPESIRGRSFHFHGTDDPAPPGEAEWLVRFGDDGTSCTVTAEHAKGDAALRGSAEALFLTLWRRRPLDTLQVVGDAEAASALRDTLRF